MAVFNNQLVKFLAVSQSTAVPQCRELPTEEKRCPTIRCKGKFQVNCVKL